MEELSLTNLLKIKDKDLVRFDSLKGLDRLLYTEEIISEFLEESKEEVHRELGTICLIDAIILNEDRNLGNILYLKDKDRYTQCLIFDNGLSLLSNLDRYHLSDKKIHAMIRSVRCKPFCTTFIEQVKLFKDVPRIVLDYDDLISSFEYIEMNKSSLVPFKEECYNRAKVVLLKQLKDTEGILWVRL